LGRIGWKSRIGPAWNDLFWIGLKRSVGRAAVISTVVKPRVAVPWLGLSCSALKPRSGVAGFGLDWGEGENSGDLSAFISAGRICAIMPISEVREEAGRTGDNRW
jgi:hypothetical protein